MDPATRELAGWKVTVRIHLPKEMTAVSGVRFILTECYPNRMTWTELLYQRPEFRSLNPAKFCIEALRHRPEPQRHDLSMKIGELLKCYQIHSMVRPYCVYIIGRPASMPIIAPARVANHFQFRHQVPPQVVTINMPNIQQENIRLIRAALTAQPKKLPVVECQFVRQPMRNSNGPMQSFGNHKPLPVPRQQNQQQQPISAPFLRGLLESKRQEQRLRIQEQQQQNKRQRLDLSNCEAAVAATTLIQLQAYLQRRQLVQNGMQKLPPVMEMEVGEPKGIIRGSGSPQRAAVDMRVASRRTPKPTDDEHWAMVDFMSGKQFNL